MPLDTAATERACNIVRRQVLDEYPDLTIQFIIYAGEGLARAIETKRGELMDHPAGEQFFPALKKMTQTGAGTRTFIGLSWDTPKSLLRFFTRRKALGCCVINADHYDDQDTLQQHLYALVWHALSLYQSPAYKKNTSPSGFIKPRAEALNAAWDDMIADAFSALVLETQGKKGSVRSLARRRCNASLEAKPNGNPDHHPFPMLVDATIVVLNEMRSAGFEKSEMFAQAYAMSAEIGITFDTETVEQWWAFTQPAQKMAWLGIDKNRILGAAVNTSEDPYARSTAYLVAETLSLDPAPVSGGGFYNFFCDPEASERNHSKLCNDILEVILSKMNGRDDQALLRSEAIRNNKKLLSGEMIGWCAPALLSLADALAKGSDAKKAFYASTDTINTNTLRHLAEIVIHLRRAGEPVTITNIANAAHENPELAMIPFNALDDLEST
jgi:hypothetical protein